MLEDEPLNEDDTAPLDTDNEITTALEAAATDFDQELRELFTNPKDYKILRTIGAFIMRGHPLREACVLSRLNYEKFEALMNKHSIIADFITFKQTAYKSTLLTVLSSSATMGRKTKVAGYLLENQYRDDFGKKTKDERVRPPDALEQALEAVRNDGDSEPLVRASLPAPTITPSRAT